MSGTLNKEIILEKNKHINRQDLEKNLELVEKLQSLGVKKEYGLASPFEVKRAQTMDISKTRSINLRQR